MENEYDQAALYRMIQESLDISCTIDEAINDSIENRKLNRQSFRLTNDLLNKVDTYVDNVIRGLKIAKLILNAKKIKNFILNDGYYEYINKMIKELDNVCLQVNNNKQLLSSLRESLNKLEYYDNIVCNVEISLLVTSIYNKTETLLNYYNDFLEEISNFAVGVTYYGNVDYKEMLKEYDNDINDSVMKLGLQK